MAALLQFVIALLRVERLLAFGWLTAHGWRLTCASATRGGAAL